MNNSYRLWSLAEMLKVSAGAFVRALHALGVIRGSTIGQQAFHTLAKISTKAVAAPEFFATQASRDWIKGHLQGLRVEATTLGASVTRISVDRMIEKLQSTDLTDQTIADLAAEIEGRLFDELTTKQVFVLGDKQSTYFAATDWRDITAKFPSASYDIDERRKGDRGSAGSAAIRCDSNGNSFHGKSIQTWPRVYQL